MSDLDDIDTSDTDDSDEDSSPIADTVPSSPSPSPTPAPNAPTPMDPKLASYLQNRAQALKDAQAAASSNRLLAGMGRAFGTLARGSGQVTAADSAAYDALDKNANAPVTDLLAKQKSEVESQSGLASMKNNDPTSPESVAAQKLLRSSNPGVYSQDNVKLLSSNDILGNLSKTAELQAKINERKTEYTMKQEDRADAKEMKQSAADEKVQTLVGKDLNSLTTSGRNALGTAAKAKVAAQRLADIVSDPNATNQDLQSAYADLNQIVSGTATVSGSAHQSYNTLSNQLSDALTYITGNPQAPDIGNIKKHVLDVANRMSAISDGVIQQNTHMTKAKYSGWVQRNPDQWQGMIDQVAAAPPQSASYQSGGEPTVNMTDPTGKVRAIPQSKVKDAMAAGGRLVQ